MIARQWKRYLTTKSVGFLAIGGLIAAGFAFNPAIAATPSSGTVSGTQRAREWTGGPFVAPNVTAQAGDQPTCGTPEACDDYKLTVNTAAGYGDRHDLTISVGWPNSAADFDVYVLDSQKKVVATAASSADPEIVILPPNSATYTVRVVPFAPLGESYKATAKLVDKPLQPAPADLVPAKFRNYKAPKALPDHNDAGEPSIGNNWNTGATFYQAYLSTYRVLFDDSVTPAKATWQDRSANAANGCPGGSTTSLDPIMFTDHETGRTYESQLTLANSLTCYTDDDGQTWHNTTGGGIPSGVDHQTIGGGNFSKNGVGGVGNVYKNSVYYCSQDIATAFCAISRDGTTFGPGVPTYDLTQCGGLHGHIKVGPDGTAYLPNKGCGATQGMAVSPDNGASWTVRHVTGSTPGDSDPSVGIGSNGTTYFGYVGADNKPAVATSHDDGKTWQYNQQVGVEFDIKNAVFPAVVAGDDNRAAFAYIGTPTGGNSQDQATFKGNWHLYISYTYDGGRHWVTSDATPNDPVQRGSICTGGTTCGDDRNLLDFMDVQIDKRGRVLVGYADGCINACVTSNDPADNGRDAYATIARQSTGRTLFGQFDPQPNLKFTAMSVQKTPGHIVANMTIRNVGNKTADGVRVRLLDGTKIVQASSSFSVPSTRVLNITMRYRTERQGKHRVIAIVDPRNLIPESNENDNKAVRTVTY